VAVSGDHTYRQSNNSGKLGWKRLYLARAAMDTPQSEFDQSDCLVNILSKAVAAIVTWQAFDFPVKNSWQGLMPLFIFAGGITCPITLTQGVTSACNTLGVSKTNGV
jgi:hypothetical protein